MFIDRQQYEEAYRCARAVYSHQMRVTDAKRHLAGLGMNPNSAADFVYIFKHMLAGEVYKRAMSAEATENFLLWIKRDYSSKSFQNALAALRKHIPFNGGAMKGHRELLRKYSGSSSRRIKANIAKTRVRILPMIPEESDGNTIEELQNDYFLGTLPRDSGCFRYKSKGLKTPEGSIVLFQYCSHIVATAIYRGSEKFGRPDANGYVGALWFDPGSIRVFSPIGAEALAQVWPEFDRFSHVKHELNLDGYRQFRRMETDIRVPELEAGAGDEGVDHDFDPYSPEGSDSREVALCQIRLRRGQQRFREELRKRYKGRCVVTGCRILALLEAAHISPYRGENDNNPENGILLRADMHTLFDLNLLAIHPEKMRIELHPDLAEEYPGVDGRQLLCDARSLPAKIGLQRRYQFFKSRLASNH